jgi:hypothetical protein
MLNWPWLVLLTLVVLVGCPSYHYGGHGGGGAHEHHHDRD